MLETERESFFSLLTSFRRQPLRHLSFNKNSASRTICDRTSSLVFKSRKLGSGLMRKQAKTLTTNQLDQLIREIRGHKVMLDFDLARVYGVETKSLNRAVKRNADRFPKDFMFQISSREWENLKYQLVPQVLAMEVVVAGPTRSLTWCNYGCKCPQQCTGGADERLRRASVSQDARIAGRQT